MKEQTKLNNYSQICANNCIFFCSPIFASSDGLMMCAYSSLPHISSNILRSVICFPRQRSGLVSPSETCFSSL